MSTNGRIVFGTRNQPVKYKRIISPYKHHSAIDFWSGEKAVSADSGGWELTVFVRVTFSADWCKCRILGNLM